MTSQPNTAATTIASESPPRDVDRPIVRADVWLLPPEGPAASPASVEYAPEIVACDDPLAAVASAIIGYGAHDGYARWNGFSIAPGAR
jgi:hypothetical protein